MAMDGNVMGSAIKEAIRALGPPAPGQSIDDFRTSLFQAIAGAIVGHIQTFAVVSSNVIVTDVTGVTPGVGVSGPGTGTATGTVS